MIETTSEIKFLTNKKYVFEKLKNNDTFERNIDLLVFAISIGVLNDQFSKVSGEESVEVARNTYTQHKTLNSLEFLFKTAILTTSKASELFEENIRVKLAFDPSYNIENFKKLDFLMGFAPYGVEVIEKEIFSEDPSNTIDNLNDFLENVFSDDLESEIITDYMNKEFNKE